MGKKFIESGFNRSALNTAAKQERQLSYFTQGELQEDSISTEYLNKWADRKYQTNDYFLNYVKTVFKTENFLSFFKYMRNPLPSAKLINNKIKPQLNRVFVAENAEFKYSVDGAQPSDIADTLKTKKFEEKLFNKLLFKHNSILVEDLDSKKANSPYRYFLDIKDVLALDHTDECIKRIAYKAHVGGEAAIIYIDGEKYQVYDKNKELVSDIPHDLGRCPAHFISKGMYKDDFIIRESIFTYIREELEEYVFLKTLQKMTEPNGAIPVVTKIETENADEDYQSMHGEPGEPNSDDVMGSQRSKVQGDNNNTQGGDLQTGTIHDVSAAAVRDADGKLNMDVVKNYLNFFYVPVEALNYIKDRIEGIENSITSTIVGTIDGYTSNEQSKNEMQVERSIIVLENTLIDVAESLNAIRKESDYDMLALKYSPDKVQEVFIFYGTDFFLESQSSLFEDLSKAPNPIERKNILVRINQNKYKNNRDQMIRQKLLYDLLPYTTDEDFEVARGTSIDPVTLQYQLRFNYWIGIFEAMYGDVVAFFNGMDSDAATRLVVINNLVIDIINKATPAQVEPATPAAQE